MVLLLWLWTVNEKICAIMVGNYGSCGKVAAVIGKLERVLCREGIETVMFVDT